jgi:hypothetical protein
MATLKASFAEVLLAKANVVGRDGSMFTKEVLEQMRAQVEQQPNVESARIEDDKLLVRVADPKLVGKLGVD